MTQADTRRFSHGALMLDACWRAAAYCLNPRVIYLSFLPLILAAVTLAAGAWWGWEGGTEGLRRVIDQWEISQALLQWLDRVGLGSLRAMLVPVLLLLLIVPLVIVACLLLVAGLMTPSLVKLVKARRFEGLASAQSTPWWRSLLWSLGSSMLAVVVLLASLPLWFVPMLAVIMPPLIWGWLTYRVMAFDTLADLATVPERDVLLKQHRTTLLIMGVACGYLGAAPTALWALGAMTVVLAPLLLVASVWIYTLVFAFSSLWFAHYLLFALQALRAQPGHQPTTQNIAQDIS